MAIPSNESKELTIFTASNRDNSTSGLHFNSSIIPLLLPPLGGVVFISSVPSLVSCDSTVLTFCRDDEPSVTSPRPTPPVVATKLVKPVPANSKMTKTMSHCWEVWRVVEWVCVSSVTPWAIWRWRVLTGGLERGGGRERSVWREERAWGEE